MKTSVHHKEFEKVIRSIARRWHLWQVFSDFCEMAALSLANAFYQRDDIEQRYMETVKRYNQDEASEFAHLLAIVVQGLDHEMQDFLGEMFMQLELGSHWHGQFFTPYDLCHMMAGLNISDATVERLKGGGFVTLSEPACGAGAMVIAFAEALRARDINYQQAMHVTAADTVNRSVSLRWW